MICEGEELRVIPKKWNASWC